MDVNSTAKEGVGAVPEVSGELPHLGAPECFPES